ncbi:hypothetical protein [Sphingomonas desiccabilis]|uniref:Uncharacterized protein n=1 Tax=Sphingomonas desiccabilis TaxID=429134 RepID=A0A4Q2ITC6_9SPHN|nr:hypothetical protein [Sphingomonas desiccabilis]MBB3911638.1 hypothetical protein [Sphingomonas desiccabilis]RXZ31628.1 hypothetical protein EO081_10360 [Sphingomonas desiccabilis]
MADEKSRDDDVWFAPKRFGYGTGWPIAWQGWVLLGGYLALLLLGSHYVAPKHPIGFGIFVGVLTIAVLGLSATHTRGGWHWRWGGKDE